MTTRELDLPELEPYVFSLLVVASEATHMGSKGPALIENAALGVALDWIGSLPAASSDSKNAHGLLQTWIGHMVPPSTAFHAAATIADALDQVVRGRHPRIKSPHSSAPTKFDQHVFLALGQTISEVVGFKNGIGPSARETWEKLAKQSPRHLQQRFVRNYIGNLLQDFFDACHVRAAIPKLPRDEEEVLRTEDAEDLADAIFATIEVSKNPVEGEKILERLGQTLKQAWKAEHDLNNAQDQREKLHQSLRIPTSGD